MVNFRFHLVSLTAVFLALAIGIGIGATVVDQGQVDVIKGQLDSVRTRTEETNAENERLRAAADDVTEFEGQAGDQLVVGRLEGVPVLVVATQGIDREPVDTLRQSIVTAGGSYQGALWFTSKLTLEKAEDIDALGQLLEIESRRGEVVRRALINRLATALTSGPDPLLVGLRDRGFVEYDEPRPATGDLASLPVPGTKLVVASAADAAVADELWAVPLTLTIATEANASVIAVEAGRFGGTPPPESPAPFVQAVRADEERRPRLSTVDNIGHWRGRMAVVLAVDALVAGRTGHYGEGPGADRQIPEAASP